MQMKLKKKDVELLYILASALYIFIALLKYYTSKKSRR